MKKKTLIVSLLFSVLSLLLAGCSQKLEMTFFENGHWKMQSNITYPKAVTDMTGGLLSAFGLDLGSSSMITDMTQTMTAGVYSIARNEFRRQGIDMDWEQKVTNNNVVILVDLSADTYEKFNSFIGLTGSGSLSYLGGDQYRLEIDYNAMNQQYYSMFGMDELLPLVDSMSMLNNYELVINTGRVINSNAHSVRGGTATWHNPTYVDITFVPRSNFRLGLIIIPILVLTAIIGISAMVRRRNARNDNEFSYSNQSYNDDFFG